VAFLVLFAGVWVLIGFKMRAGRGWHEHDHRGHGPRRDLHADVGRRVQLAGSVLSLVENLLAIAVVVYMFRRSRRPTSVRRGRGPA